MGISPMEINRIKVNDKYLNFKKKKERKLNTKYH